MSLTEGKLASGHSSSQCSNTLDTFTPKTARPIESDPSNEAVTSARIANLATATGRCRCGRDFVATSTLYSIHEPAIEVSLQHGSQQAEQSLCKNCTVNSVPDQPLQIVNATVQNNNAYQFFGGGYAHHEHSTSSPQNLSCNANPSQYPPGANSPTKFKIKKKKYLSKYLEKWEKEINVRLCWLTKGREEGNAYCLVCKRDILIKHMGKSAVLEHVKGKKHSSRIALIETNLHLIRSGALQTHLNMSDYVIPAHENVMSDRTQKTELTMREQGKQEQQEDIIQDERRATNYSDEWTVRCNCGQTEKFFQEILNVSDSKELNGGAGRMYDNRELHATIHKSLDSSADTAPRNRNCLSYDPLLSAEAYSHRRNSRNACNEIDVEISNPFSIHDLVNSELTNTIYPNITSSYNDEAGITHTQYQSKHPSNQSLEHELEQTVVDMSSFDGKPESPSQ